MPGIFFPLKTFAGSCRNTKHAAITAPQRKIDMCERASPLRGQTPLVCDVFWFVRGSLADLWTPSASSHLENPYRCYMWEKENVSSNDNNYNSNNKHKHSGNDQLIGENSRFGRHVHILARTEVCSVQRSAWKRHTHTHGAELVSRAIPACVRDSHRLAYLAWWEHCLRF